MYSTLSTLKEDLKFQNESLTNLENGTSSLHLLEPTVVSLEKEITLLQAKRFNLQCRSHRSNIRVVRIPEGLEGPQPTKFVVDVKSDKKFVKCICSNMSFLDLNSTQSMAYSTICMA